MLTVHNYTSLEWLAFELSLFQINFDVIMYLGYEMTRSHNKSLFACASKLRLSTGTVKMCVFARLQLDEHALQISNGLKKVVGVTAA